MTRLQAALDAGLDLPEGRALVLRPGIGFDLSGLDSPQVVQGFKPAFDHFAPRVETLVAPEGAFAVALVCATRSKEQTRGLIAEAAARAPLLLVDGQKTDGIESLLKEAKKRGTVSHVTSKAHGKLFAVQGDFSDWATGPHEVDGFVTQPGVFSADGVDGGSALLAERLPAKLPARVADLGAGWGYLSRQILAREGVKALHLVEAEHLALDCARQNLDDPRAQFHWADATRWAAEGPLDAVVMNPPFHQSGSGGRAAEPSLGQAFLSQAARILGSHGKLWCVANRQLPYERVAAAHFAQVAELEGDRRYKIIFAEKPLRARGANRLGSRD